ncbi:MAG: MarR family transcriptional regulator [Desulfobacteraceae bacterium]|nr:MAG: MarR family transcriptional regulator [Desulfobacteraceae bacterium]
MPDISEHVEAMRRFNRFYTRRIGVLNEHLLRSRFSLAEARVIYELANHEETTATALGNQLGLDTGYLSRILQNLIKQDLIDKKPSDTDGRQSFLSLSKKGQEAFARLNSDSRSETETVLNNIPEQDQDRLIEAMHTIEGLLSARTEHRSPYLLRYHQPGDMGWVIQRHGMLYHQEYGWDEQFEALVAEIAAKFIRKYDPKRERCWIAEKNGVNIGSVFLVKKSKTAAQLRLLLVEPKARGMGIGKRLVGECTRFARQAGYRKIMLWTNSILHAARHIYEQKGFRLVQEEPHHSFGHDLVGQNWELDLHV